jgi:diacylglycerol kinase family enzyme
MDSTPQASKRRFGTLAYLWTGVKRLAGWQPTRFQLEIDGRSLLTAAIEVSVTNTRVAGGRYFHWGEDIKVDDGRVCVCAVRGKTLVDYLLTIFDFLVGRADRSSHILCFAANQKVHIEAQEPLPVQGDGEVIGETPIDITILPQVIHVVVPCQADGAG